MAALPSPTQVAGNNSAIYEAYYNVVDPKGYGTVGGMEAARFLKKSGLSDVILSKIWDMSDPGGRGCLDKTGIFIALKLVALVQNGHDLNISNINMDIPPPKMGDVPLPKPSKPPPPRSSLITSNIQTSVDWTIKPSERDKYDKLFDSLQPANGLIPGNKVKNLLMESKLPFLTLGKIWDLADQDKDGMLNRHEFVVAMHLVYKALDRYAIPTTLPPELLEQVSAKTSTLAKNKEAVKTDLPPLTIPTSISPIPTKTVSHMAPIPPLLNWVVSNEEKEKSDALFMKSDIDKDGFVNGHEIKDIFLQSGVPQPILAHIWALCDIKQIGKLNDEQFALAMWLIARCLKGIEPPVTLTAEMVPPSFRNSKPIDGLVENNNTRYSNPELDMITKDIEELSREKLLLETDITQKEADLKIKSGEIKSLQSELDTLAATLKQLENQKGEAQKRLNDLKAQKSQVDGEIESVNKEFEDQSAKVDKLRVQAAEQAEMVKTQETELNSKKEQLEGLRAEEERLEKQKAESINKLKTLSLSLQDTQLSISQAKALITQLQEQTRQMNDAISACDSTIETNDISQIPDGLLKIKPEFRNSEYKKILDEETKTQNGFDIDPFSNQNGHSSVGFDVDPFQNDPFKKQDAFSNDQFSVKFSETNNTFSSDPFGGSFSTNSGQDDPFNAFDNPQNKSATTEADKDPFGCDPFAILHAPTRDGSAPPRPSSPSPALPPKKSKNPPPRPAPPRPQPPNLKKSQQADAFGSDPFGNRGGFADFSDFDAKCLHRCPLVHYTQLQFPSIQTHPFLSHLLCGFSSNFMFNDKPIAKVQAQSSSVLDFTDDPFQNYRYEDPCNITFDDEQPAPVKKIEEKEKFDPFGLDGRQSVPLPSSDPFVDSSGRASAPTITETFSEDQQLAWAARESIKLEEDRRKRQLQEQADLELAISLSKAESKQTSSYVIIFNDEK